MDLWELIAYESIRDLVQRYNSTADSGRFDETLTLFAEDAVLEHSGGRFEGHVGIRGQFEGTAGDLRHLIGTDGRLYLRHFTATHQIDLVDTSHATGRCYFQVLLPQGLDHWGRYVDRYEQRDGRWLFAHRKVTVDGFRPGGIGDASARG